MKLKYMEPSSTAVLVVSRTVIALSLGGSAEPVSQGDLQSPTFDDELDW